MREDRGAFGGTRQIASDVASSEGLARREIFSLPPVWSGWAWVLAM